MDWKERTRDLIARAAVAARKTWSFCLRWGRRGWKQLLIFCRAERTHEALRRAGRGLAVAWRLAGRRALRVSLAGGAVLLMTLGVGLFGVHRVAPGEIGVRVSDWSGEGVARQDFGPGLHLGIAHVHAWHRLPSGTEWVAWRAASQDDPGTMLGVRTQNGNEVLVAVAVPFRILGGEAHQIVMDGDRNTYRGKVSARTEKLLLEELGRLSSEEFTDTDARNEVLANALVKLNDSLAAVHVVAEAILLEDVRFPAPYEKKLQETQLEQLRGKMLAASQAVSEEELVISRRKLESERELQERRIVLERGIQEVKLAAEAEHEELERETARYVAEQAALATREYEALALEGRAQLLAAEALEDELVGKAYASEGGRLWLARLTAEATRIESVTLDANDPRVPNVLDPDAMMELFLGE